MNAGRTSNGMLPARYRVAHRQVETHDSVTLWLEPTREQLGTFRPGQFSMLYAHGIGEVPISVSGYTQPGDGTLVHTIRDVGAVSHALYDAPLDTMIGVRGPFGTTWALDTAMGTDLVIVAGGVGLAPLRPVLLGALARRSAYSRIVLVVGARAPDHFLFWDELTEWSGRDDLDVHLTVDAPTPGWNGPVGFVTDPLGLLSLEPANTVAFLCGPEPMMRFSASVLLRKYVPANRIRLSLERTMKCGIGLCGHCQLGPILVCRDGPVVDYAFAEPLLAVKEL